MRIGMDIGGTKTEIVVLNPTGEALFKKRVATPDNYPDFIENIASLVALAESEAGSCDSVGICLPGAISPDTGRMKNANCTYLNGHKVREDLTEKLNRPVQLANDADCFTLSEATDGAAAGARSCFGVIIGTGCGGGLVYNGYLVSGPNAIAGEWGHNPLPGYHPDIDGPEYDCYCGRRQCIESFVSGTGMARVFRDTTGIEVSDARAVMELAEAGDPQALEHFERYLDSLARALGSIINVFDPEVIVLGGGMSNVQALYQRLPEKVAQYVFSDQLNTRILPAKYGDSSGIRGAAWLK